MGDYWAVWAAFGRPLERLLGASRRLYRGSNEKPEKHNVSKGFWDSWVALGELWAALGRLLAALERVLGGSRVWAALGGSWAVVGRLLGGSGRLLGGS